MSPTLIIFEFPIIHDTHINNIRMFIYTGQPAPIFILTSEMNFSCPITCKLTHNLKNMWLDDPKRNSWLLARRSECSNYIFDTRNRIPVPNNRHTTCKICGKMTHTVTSSYQRADHTTQMSVLTTGMNSSSQFTSSLIYRMLLLLE